MPRSCSSQAGYETGARPWSEVFTTSDAARLWAASLKEELESSLQLETQLEEIARAAEKIHEDAADVQRALCAEAAALTSSHQSDNEESRRLSEGSIVKGALLATLALGTEAAASGGARAGASGQATALATLRGNDDGQSRRESEDARRDSEYAPSEVGKS